jgi:hypothetical protein
MEKPWSRLNSWQAESENSSRRVNKREALQFFG